MHRASLSFAVAALVLGVLTSAAFAQEELPPTELAAEQAEAELAALMPDAASFDGGELVATAQGKPQWRLKVMAVFPDQKKTNSTALVGPWIKGRYIYYCVKNHLYRTHLLTGQVNARALLPGRCLDLQGPADALKLSLKGGEGRWEWEQTIELNEATFDASHVELGDHMGRVMLRSQGSAQSRGINPLQREEPEAWADYLKRVFSPPDPKLKADLQEHLQWLQEQAQRDPTNPWLLYERGLIETYLGQPQQAAKSFEALLKWDGMHKEELLAMVHQLDEIDASLGQRAFEIGLKSLLERGYDPDLSSSLINLMILYGKPNASTKLDELIKDDAGYELLTRRADRLAMLAPKVEGVVYFWSGMRRAAAARGDAAREAQYAKLEQEARPYRLFGVGGDAVTFTGDWMNLYIAAVLSLLMLFIIKTLRTFSASYRAKQGQVNAALKFNLLTRWSYPELVGTIFVVPLIIYFGQKAAQGVMIVGIMAGAPVQVVSSDLGNPTALKYIQEIKSDLPEVKYIQAISYQHAGQDDKAQALYEQVGNAASFNNLGVIRFKQGKVEEAKALFEKAASLSPNALEPAHNLGRELPQSDSIRAQRIKRFKLDGKLLVPPTPKQWERFWKARITLSDEDPSSLRALPGLLNLVSNTSQELPVILQLLMGSSSSLLGLLIFGIAVILLIFGLAAMVTPRSHVELKAPKYGQLGWALGLIVPGASKQYHVLGPFVCILFITSVLCAMTMSNTDGVFTNMLDAIAVPSFSRYFGLSSPYEPEQTFFHTLGRWWWALLVAHFAFIVVMERLRPDDAGPLAKRFGAK